MKEKMIAGMLVFALAIGLGACGVGNDEKDPENGQIPGNEQELGEDTSPVDQDIEDGDDEGMDNSTDQTKDEDKNTTGSGGKPSGSQNNAQKPETDNATGNTGGARPAISGSFEEIIGSIYDKVGYDVKTSMTEVTSDNAEYYLGTSGLTYKKALASEPMMSSIAHSVVLLEMEEGADLSDIKKKIKDNVDGYKWVCVGVEAENILVGNVGNYVLLVMDEDAQSFMDAFLAMGK